MFDVTGTKDDWIHDGGGRREYAARSGGREEKYAGGNDVDRVAWYDANSKGTAHPVGEKIPLFTPMLRLIKNIGTLNFATNPSDYASAKLLNHPCPGMFFRNRV